MKVRVIDYLANPGGGVRFTAELMRGFLRHAPRVQLELITHGQALETYRALIRNAGPDVTVTDVPSPGYWRTRPATRVLGLPGTGRLKRWMGFDSEWLIQVPGAALEDCDVAWFPWVHRHHLPPGRDEHVTASFHDAIVFQWPDLIPAARRDAEAEAMQGWLASRARVVVSSEATRRAVADYFHVAAQRLKIVPVGWDHAPRVESATAPAWAWAQGRYLFYPANTSPHKNHEVLFEAYAAWGAKVPLVLTGYGTDLPAGDQRARYLRRLAAAQGLAVGSAIIPLGYVDDAIYYALLARAWALVMPSLLEGGGSFPVLEAMGQGIPVICADLPVLREQIARTGGDVLWCDPHSAEDLRRRLDDVERSYPAIRARALAQVTLLRRRTWQDVADDYLEVFAAPAPAMINR